SAAPLHAPNHYRLGKRIRLSPSPPSPRRAHRPRCRRRQPPKIHRHRRARRSRPTTCSGISDLVSPAFRSDELLLVLDARKRLPPQLRLGTEETILSAKIREIRSHSSSRSEEHTSELQSLAYLVCRLLLEK